MELEITTEEALAYEMALMLASSTFIPFATLKASLGIGFSDIIKLKTPAESIMRLADDDLRLVSVMHGASPGLGVDA